MARKIAVNAEEAEKYIGKARMALEGIKASAKTCLDKLAPAKEQTSNFKLYNSIEDICLGICKRTDEADECMGEILTGIKGFENDMHDELSKDYGLDA